MILFSSEKDEESEESEATAGQHGELWCFKKKKKNWPMGVNHEEDLLIF